MRKHKLLQQFIETIYKSGRIHKTVSLAPLSLKSQQTAADILSNISAGKIFLCARILSGNEIAESEETNNLRRIPIQAIS